MMSEFVGARCAAWEIKQTTGRSIPFAAVAPHQLAALRQVGSVGGLTYKISDEARRKNPFDAFKLAGVEGYVVACFTGRDARVCYVVKAKDWRGASLKSPPVCVSKFSL